MKHEASLKRQASIVAAQPVPSALLSPTASALPSSTPISGIDPLSRHGSFARDAGVESAAGAAHATTQGDNRAGFLAVRLPRRDEAHAGGWVGNSTAETRSLQRVEQRRDQEPLQRQHPKGGERGPVMTLPGPPRRPDRSDDPRLPLERQQGLKRHYRHEDPSEEGEVAPSPLGSSQGGGARSPVAFYPREPSFPCPPPYDGGSSWREGHGMRGGGGRPRMHAWNPPRGGRDSNDRPRDWERGVRGRGGWRGGGSMR